jgi:hypothetical protein
VSASFDDRLRSRIYFYTDTGNGIAPESGVGGQPHAVTLEYAVPHDAEMAQQRQQRAQAARPHRGGPVPAEGQQRAQDEATGRGRVGQEGGHSSPPVSQKPHLVQP